MKALTMRRLRGCQRNISHFVDAFEYKTRPASVVKYADQRAGFSTQPKSVFRCSSCGKEVSRWSGQCSQCKSWNTLTEVNKTAVAKEHTKIDRERQKWVGDGAIKVESLSQQANSAQSQRILIADPELKRVFGGGLVYGSVVLLAGTPGVGKSTLALQLSDTLARQLQANGRALYVSGEESVDQVGMRAKRLKVSGNDSFSRVDIVNQPSLNRVLDLLHKDSPYKLLVVDSIQTVFLDDVEADAGGIVQIKACALACVHMAKASNIPVILVGHVTKSGDVAGPKLLEHLVDVVLYFDGETSGSEIRWLHCHKNRFGPNEVGVFHLTDAGLVPVAESNLSFVSHLDNVPEGVAWCVTTQGSQGTRFVVAEIQALTNPIQSLGEMGGRPRKLKTSGIPSERIEWITAVLARHVPGVKILNQSDLFLNVIGGLQTSDRGNDLAFGIAMASSALNREVIWPVQGNRSGIAFIGEVGLTGDIRAPHAMWSRINAASKAGLAKVAIPEKWWHEHGKSKALVANNDIELVPVGSLKDTVDSCLVSEKPILNKLRPVRGGMMQKSS